MGGLSGLVAIADDLAAVVHRQGVAETAAEGAKVDHPAPLGPEKACCSPSLAVLLCLAGAAAAGAAMALPTIIPSSALGADGAVAPSNRIVMGFIGVGSQGTGDMRGFLSHDVAQMVAVCDVDADNLKRAK